MTPCSPGYYSLVDELECTVSPPGKYAFRTDQDLTEITDDLYYADIGATGPKRCPVGHYCPDKTGRHITTCPPGYFTDPTDTSCTICPAG
jgi:hypothetical protein